MNNKEMMTKYYYILFINKVFLKTIKKKSRNNLRTTIFDKNNVKVTI